MKKMMIVFDGMKMDWDKEEIEKFRLYWEYGLEIKKIAKIMRCKEMEVVLLAMDQMKKRKIERVEIMPDRGEIKWTE